MNRPIPARLPTARLTWTLVIVTLLLASGYGVWRFLSVEPDEALIAAQNRAADASEAPQNDAAVAPATKSRNRRDKRPSRQTHPWC
jgi:cytoskeleton protein RodZ